MWVMLRYAMWRGLCGESIENEEFRGAVVVHFGHEEGAGTCVVGILRSDVSAGCGKATPDGCEMAVGGGDPLAQERVSAKYEVRNVKCHLAACGSERRGF